MAAGTAVVDTPPAEMDDWTVTVSLASGREVAIHLPPNERRVGAERFRLVCAPRPPLLPPLPSQWIPLVTVLSLPLLLRLVHLALLYQTLTFACPSSGSQSQASELPG